MFIESISMKDFRCFEQAETTFVYPGKDGLSEEVLPNVTLLMGENGSGKTSTLRAGALLSLVPIIQQMGYWPYDLVRVAAANTRQPVCTYLDANFVVHSQDANDEGRLGARKTGRTEHNSLSFFEEDGYTQIDSWVCGATFEHPTTPMYDAQSPVFFLLGYGATRRTEYLENLDGQRSRRRHPRYQRVAGLFEDYITLYPLAAWYPTLESKARAKEVRALLNSLLPESTEFTGTFQDAEAVFAHNGVNLPFGALSDGFRSYIGLVADMLYHLNHVCPKKSKLTDLTGVVLIDDIDVHLHPKWQREVLPKLAGTFLNLQFIITSHSPLVAGTLHAANIRVVEDNKISEYTERIDGLTSDQILTSSYFGLDSTRSPAAEKKLAGIADRLADTHDPKVALDYIRQLTGQPNGNGKKKPKKPAKP